MDKTNQVDWIERKCNLNRLDYLSCHQCFASSRRSKEEDAFDVLASKLFHDLWWEDPGGKGSSEDCIELSIQSTDAHLAEVPIWVDDALTLHFALGLASQEDRGAFSLLKDY